MEKKNIFQKIFFNYFRLLKKYAKISEAGKQIKKALITIAVILIIINY